MIIAQPSEWPGIHVSNATKRLYIGLYTRFEMSDLNEPGEVRFTETIRSPKEVFIAMIYFPGWVENILYSGFSERIAVDHQFIVIELQKSGAVSFIPVSGRESIEIAISLQGLIITEPEVVLWIVTFGIFGITIPSFSTERYTSVTTGRVLCFGKNQYCTKSDTRNATAKRLIRRSLSIKTKLVINISTFFYFSI
jgi:hypothetical protein